jgi:putative tricarboxylic transport membrane protein
VVTSEFIAGLGLAISWPAIGFLLVGVLLGLLVGLLPGIDNATAIVLLLPFLFFLGPVSGFSLLLGMAGTTNTAGEVTSILFGIPGEGTTAATVIDGYAMTRKGMGGRALGASLASSFLGALIGGLALFLAIPIVRPLVLALFYPDFLMLTVIGVIAIAAVSGTAPLRGAAVGALGVLLATVGVDPGTGLGRLTFGLPYLVPGISLPALALGMFAIPSLIDMAMRRETMPSSGGASTNLQGIRQGIGDVFVYWKVTLTGSLLGTLVAIVPGLGGAVAQWTAYAGSIAVSGDRHRFGHGAVEGVIGPSAAVNSKDGASLIPTVGFGIPGTVIMGLFLGAFTLTGLHPGREMLTTDLPITMSFVWDLILGNLIAVPIILLICPQLIKLGNLEPARYLPFILAMVIIAAYAASSTMADVVTMTLFGGLGYVMMLARFPRGPLVVGFILGQSIETNFRYTYGYYGFDWLTRPDVVILFGFGILVLFIGHRVARAARTMPVESALG